MKKGLRPEEVEGLIKATEENRVRLRKAWEKIEDLQAAVDASQDARIERQERRSTEKPKHRKE